MARTVLLGKPDQKKIDTMKKTIEALHAGIDVTKPGNTADDVAQAFWKVLDKYGIEKKSRTGYSIGIGYPPDWGEHTLNIYKGDMTPLEPNICFHMIAGDGQSGYQSNSGSWFFLCGSTGTAPYLQLQKLMILVASPK